MQQAINAIAGTIAAFISSFLPYSNGFPPEVYNGLHTLLGYSNQLGFIIPYGTMWSIMTLIMILEIGILTFKVAKWLIGLAGPFAAIGALAAATVGTGVTALIAYFRSIF